MENERSRSRENDETMNWIAAHGDELVIGGPMIATVSEITCEMDIMDKDAFVEKLKRRVVRQMVNGGTSVSPGLGMGWPELKDLRGTTDFANET